MMDQKADRPPGLVSLRKADPETDSAACYALMRQLRPHLVSEDEFLSRWRRQAVTGYQIAGLWAGTNLVALAGFRVLDNLVHGVHLYVDDLVTNESSRGAGHGRMLIEHLKTEARGLRCSKLILDTPLTNTLGHRFYYRHGLLATALRFSLPISGSPSCA